MPLSVSSPSLRRVWVEIDRESGICQTLRLSPSLRRVWVEMSPMTCAMYSEPCHPPCGGCGLKCNKFGVGAPEPVVTLLAEGVG